MGDAVAPLAIPSGALLRRYADDGAFADCYATEVQGPVSLAQFVTAFYTSRAFRPERWLLHLARRPSNDTDVARLAAGATTTFAAWSVEARTPDELLLRDMTGRTRSWLHVAPRDGATRLYFGSAVVPKSVDRGQPRFGPLFGSLLGFHGLYSRVLLASARDAWLRGRG